MPPPHKRRTGDVGLRGGWLDLNVPECMFGIWGLGLRLDGLALEGLVELRRWVLVTGPDTLHTLRITFLLSPAASLRCAAFSLLSPIQLNPPPSPPLSPGDAYL